MRPKTSESGIFSTKRKSPVSTSMLTRMLVPKPKKAFQSPGVQIAGLCVPLVTRSITRSCPSQAHYDFHHPCHGGPENREQEAMSCECNIQAGIHME